AVVGPARPPREGVTRGRGGKNRAGPILPRPPAESGAAPPPRLEMRPASRAGSTAVAPTPRPAEPAREPVAIARFEDLIALAEEKRDLPARSALERDVRLVRLEDGKLEIALEPGASKSLVHELSRKLAEWTGR